jgi:hypothetical protein
VVDRRVAGEHADVRRAEDAAEREELLADQRLDRCGVETAPSGREELARSSLDAQFEALEDTSRDADVEARLAALKAQSPRS